MSQTSGLSFDTPPLVMAFCVIAFAIVVGLAWYAWRRSGFDHAIGWLELLRTVIAAMVVVTLCQPEWKEVYAPDERPVLAVLKDRSSSMDTRDIVDAENPLGEPVARRQWMERQLDALPWAVLEGKVDVVQHSFGSADMGADLRSATNLNAALEDARKRHENLRAAIVLSDGDWNQGDSPANAATRYRIHRLPVYAVALGSPESLPDIDIGSLEPPTFSVIGKSLQIPFTLRSTLATDYEANVTLTVRNGETLTKSVTIPAMGQVRELFFWTPDEIGDVELTLDVPPHPEETLRENNVASVTVAIKAESLRVLVIESVPRWEYRYLRNALERDPGVQVSCLLFLPGLSKRGGGSGYLSMFPQTDEELANYDVVFLGDVGAKVGQLTGDDCRRLKGLVESQASGLIFMPGISGHQASLAQTDLDELYPVFLDSNAPHGFGSQIASSPVLTDLGQTSLLMKLADTARENTSVWRSLPGFQWRSPAVRARAGCDVLAIHEDSRAPLLVTKTYGTGKILFMGTDGAWRWREGVEDKYHYRFWGQVARWMAYQRHMAEGEMLRVFYTPDRPSVGNTVTLNATVMDPNGVPFNQGTVDAELVEPQGGTRRLRFSSSSEGWGLYTARFTPNQLGPHPLTLRCQETAAVLRTTLNVQGKEREVIGKPARLEVLEEITQITRGEVISHQQMNRLCDVVLELPPPAPSIRRKQIWASPYWAGTLIAAMALFWIGRKMVGAI